MRKQAESTVFVDNEVTRVTEWRMAPGSHTGWHRHEFDYVVVPSKDGRLLIDLGEGKSSHAEMKAQVPYFRETGVEHDVINDGTEDYAFIEVEWKGKRA